jgi:predicted transcriptional regulator
VGVDNNLKQLKSSLRDLSEIFERSITVKDIAEPLASFDVSSPVDDVKKFMDDKDYDVIGLRKNGLIVGYAKKSDLSRGKIEIINFKEDEKFSETTPLINVLEAFQSFERIFVFIFGEVGGIVTRGDLQKSPVRMWLFGLISLIEMQTLRLIRHCYPHDSWINNVSDKIDKKRIENQFKKYKKLNAAIDRAECLNLREKWIIINSNNKLLNKLNIKKEQYSPFVEKLKNLRDILAHQRNIITHDWPENIDIARNAEEFLQKCEEF